MFIPNNMYIILSELKQEIFNSYNFNKYFNFPSLGLGYTINNIFIHIYKDNDFI
jgi:hypothetical protein